MTDFEILMGKTPEPPAPLEVQKYSEWSDTAPLNHDQIQNRLDYSNYLREEYLKADQYNVGIEQEIRSGLSQSLLREGLVAEDDPDMLESFYKPPASVSFDRQVDLIQSTIDFQTDSDWETITRYKALKKVVDTDPHVMPDTVDKLEAAKAQVESIVDNRFDDVKRTAVNNGELAFAIVQGDDGKPEFIAGDRATKSDLITALKDSKLGGVQMSDAFIAQDQLTIQEGTEIPKYKYKRLREAHDMILELSEQEESFRHQISGHGSRLARSEWDKADAWEWFLDDAGQDISDAAGWLIGKVTGGEQDERTKAARDERAAISRAGGIDFNDATRELARRLNEGVEQSDAFSLEEVKTAYKQAILNDANANNKFEFHDGDDEVGKNIRTYGYLGPVVHPAAMANKDVFDRMLAARPDIDDKLKQTLTDSRVAFFECSFSDMSDTLGRSGQADEWNQALTEGRANGRANHEILSDFLADEKNFNGFAERTKGVAWSLWDSFTGLAAAIPAAFGAEWAQDTLVNSARRNSDRREVANLFGEDFGFGQDIAETIAPLLVDVGATAVLAVATAPAGGAGGAAYLAARQGGRLTAKGLGKALTSSAFRPALTKTGKETTKEAAERLVKEDLIKLSLKETKEGTFKGAEAAIKGYNGLFAKRFGIATASFIPAATRSGSATYGTLFHQLQQNTDLSRAEIHDRALGGAMMAGAFTGFITAGFGALGRGGVEDALLKGMSFKKLSGVLQSVANTKGIGDQTVAKAMALQLKAQLKKYKFSGARSLLGNVVDEAQEEALDEFVNGFIVDAVLEENTPMLERMSQSLYAGALGGVMGAGVPAVQRINAKFRPNRFGEAAAGARLRRDFYEGVASRLEGTDSPLTAEAVRQTAKTAARIRAAQPAGREAKRRTVPTVGDRETTFELETGVAPVESEVYGFTPAATIQVTEEEISSRFPDSPPVEELQKIAEEAGLPTEVEEGVEDITARTQLMQRIVRAEKAEKIAEVATPSATARPTPTGPAPDAPAAPAGPTPELIVGTEPPATFGATDDAASTFLFQLEDALNTEEGMLRLQRGINDFVAVEETIDVSGEGKISLPMTPSREKDFSELTFKLGGPRRNVVAQRLGLDQMQVIVTETGRLALVDPLPDRKKSVAAYAEFRPSVSLEGVDVSEAGHFDLSAFKAGEEITESEMAEVLEYATLAVRFGVPVRVSASARFGLPASSKYSDKSDLMAKVIYNRYPVIEVEEPAGGKGFKSSRKRTFFNLKTGKKEEGKKITGVVDRHGRGLFNNDPVVVAEMLAHNIPVAAPPEGTENINPAFKIRDGWVVDVLRPTLDGQLKESMVAPVDKVGSVEANHDLANAWAGLPFIVDYDKILPDGAHGLASDGSDLVSVGMSMAELDVQLERFLDAYTADPAQFDSFMDFYGDEGNKLDDIAFREAAITGASTEFRRKAELFELRSALLDRRKKFTARIGNKVTVAPNKKKAVVRELLSRMREDVPKKEGVARLRTLTSIKKSETPTDTEVIVQFVEEHVLNADDFAGGSMPTFTKIVRRNVDRYLAQQEARGTHEKNAAFVSMHDQDAMDALGLQNVENQAIYVDGQDTSDPLPPQVFAGVVKRTLDDAVGSIREDSELKDALTDLAFQSIYPDPDPEMATHVRSMLETESGVKQLMNSIGGWMATNPTNPDAAEFVRLLESGRFRSGLDLRTSLKLNAIANRLEGDPSQDEEMVELTRELITESLGQPASRIQAVNFIKAMDQSIRRRLSRSHLTDAEREQAALNNEIEIAFLGLESGNPDSVVEALQKIVESSENPNHKLVAEMLLEDEAFIRNVGFSMGEANLEVAGEYVRGADGSHRVFINTASGNGRGLENVLLEEYVHAFLSDTLNNPYLQLTPKQRLARQRLQGLHAMAMEQYAASDETNAILEDGLVNLDEFVASFLLSPEFQYHIKKLDTPQGQRGFFRRIIESITGLFRKVTPTEGKQFADAMEDILDLGRTTHRNVTNKVMPAVAYDAAQATADANERRAKMRESFAGRIRERQTEAAEAAEPTTIPQEAVVFITEEFENTDRGNLIREKSLPEIIRIAETADAVGPEGVLTEEQVFAVDIRNTLFNYLETNQEPDADTAIGSFGERRRLEALREEETAQLKEEIAETEGDPVVAAELRGILDFLRERLPLNNRLEFDESIDRVAMVDGPTVIINRDELAALIHGLDPFAQKAIAYIIAHEELAHVASFRSLTDADINSIMEVLSDEDFDAIAEEYGSGILNSEQRAARVAEMKANLRSEDPAVAYKERWNLVEEKLRMQLQKATKGFTTEEDTQFWSQNPKLLSILKRYISAAINRFIANRRLSREPHGPLDSAIHTLMNEMIAIEANFERDNKNMNLNFEAPAEVLETFRRAMNVDTIEETADQAEEEAIVFQLFTQASANAPLFNAIMRASDYEMVEGKRFVQQVPRDRDADGHAAEQAAASRAAEQAAQTARSTGFRGKVNFGQQGDRRIARINPSSARGTGPENFTLQGYGLDPRFRSLRSVKARELVGFFAKDLLGENDLDFWGNTISTHMDEEGRKLLEKLKRNHARGRSVEMPPLSIPISPTIPDADMDDALMDGNMTSDQFMRSFTVLDPFEETLAGLKIREDLSDMDKKTVNQTLAYLAFFADLAEGADIGQDVDVPVVFGFTPSVAGDTSNLELAGLDPPIAPNDVDLHGPNLEFHYLITPDASIDLQPLAGLSGGPEMTLAEFGQGEPIASRAEGTLDVAAFKEAILSLNSDTRDVKISGFDLRGPLVGNLNGSIVIREKTNGVVGERGDRITLRLSGNGDIYVGSMFPTGAEPLQGGTPTSIMVLAACLAHNEKIGATKMKTQGAGSGGWRLNSDIANAYLDGGLAQLIDNAVEEHFATAQVVGRDLNVTPDEMRKDFKSRVMRILVGRTIRGSASTGYITWPSFGFRLSRQKSEQLQGELAQYKTTRDAGGDVSQTTIARYGAGTGREIVTNPDDDTNWGAKSVAQALRQTASVYRMDVRVFGPHARQRVDPVTAEIQDGWELSDDLSNRLLNKVEEAYAEQLKELDEFESSLAKAGEETGSVHPDSNPDPSGVNYDMFGGMHLDFAGDNETEATRTQAATRKRNMRKYWAKYGYDNDYEFDLTKASTEIKAIVRSPAFQKIIQNPDIKEARQGVRDKKGNLIFTAAEGSGGEGPMVPVSEGYDAEVRRAKKELGADTPAFAEERQRIADKYNSQLHEKGYEYNVFSSAQAGDSPLTSHNFENAPRRLEIPMVESGAFKAPQGWFNRIFKNELTEPRPKLHERINTNYRKVHDDLDEAMVDAEEKEVVFSLASNASTGTVNRIMRHAQLRTRDANKFDRVKSEPLDSSLAPQVQPLRGQKDSVTWESRASITPLDADNNTIRSLTMEDVGALLRIPLDENGDRTVPSADIDNIMLLELSRGAPIPAIPLPVHLSESAEENFFQLSPDGRSVYPFRVLNTYDLRQESNAMEWDVADSLQLSLQQAATIYHYLTRAAGLDSSANVPVRIGPPNGYIHADYDPDIEADYMLAFQDDSITLNRLASEPDSDGIRSEEPEITVRTSEERDPSEFGGGSKDNPKTRITPSRENFVPALLSLNNENRFIEIDRLYFQTDDDGNEVIHDPKKDANEIIFKIFSYESDGAEITQEEIDKKFPDPDIRISVLEGMLEDLGVSTAVEGGNIMSPALQLKRRIIIKERDPESAPRTLKVMGGYEGDLDWRGTKVHWGNLFPIKGLPDKGMTGTSVANDLLNVLYGNNDKIGATEVTTFAGGEGQNIVNQKLASAAIANLSALVTAAAQKETDDPKEVAGIVERFNRTIRLDLYGDQVPPMTGYVTWVSVGFGHRNDPETQRKIKGFVKAGKERTLNANKDRLLVNGHVTRNLGERDAKIRSAIEYAAVAAGLNEWPADNHESAWLPAVQAERARMLEEVNQLATLLNEAALRKDPNAALDAGDLHEAMHSDIEGETIKEAAERKRTVKKLWRSYGSGLDVEFDFREGSDSSRTYGKIVLQTQVLRDPRVLKLIGRFHAEASKLKAGSLDNNPNFPKQFQELRNRYNAEFQTLGAAEIRDPQGNVVGTQVKYDFKLFASSGAGPSKTGHNFGNIVQLLEAPEFESGAYKQPKGFFNRLFRGDLGDPVRRLVEQRNEFGRASDDLLSKFKKKFDGLLLAAFGKNPSPDVMKDIAMAQGYPDPDVFVDGNLVNDASLKKLDKDHNDRRRAINQNTALTPAQREAQIKASLQRRDNAIESLEQAAKQKVLADQRSALRRIGAKSPQLAAHIIDIREQLIIPLQDKLKNSGISDPLMAKIDNTGGFYLTRAYAMFTDPTYASRVRNDSTYKNVRDAAARLFEKQFFSHHLNAAKDSGKSDTEARKIAKAELDKANKSALSSGVSTTYGDQMVMHVLDNYDGTRPTDATSAAGFKVIENNLKQRKDLPREFRDLLGELGPEVGTDLIVRTATTVSTITSQQSFLKNMADLGTKNGWMVTAADYAADPDKFPDYVPIRKGTPSANDPLKFMYAPKELVDSLELVLGGSYLSKANTTAQEAVGVMANVAQKLTGKAMVAKTLGSVGFYLRNMLGNVIFFGPAQGYGRLDKMISTTLKHTIQRMTDPDKLDAELTELVGLGVIGDEVRAGIMRELLQGKAAPETVLAKLDELTDDMVAVSQGKKAMEWLEKKAIDLSASVDGAFKMAYFDHEYRYLLRAAKKHPNSKIGKMLQKPNGEYLLKREAARKVKMTAQSLSQAPPLVTEMSRSQFGILFAPFLRFKAEVPRIVINTYKLGFEEMRSDNPLIKRRGLVRITSMSLMTGAASAAIPAALAALSGIGEDEDEALRKSMPSYLRGHTFWIIRDEDGNLKSADLTYLNPFSLLADPVMRSIENIRRGEFGKAGAAFASGLIFDTYLDDQILAGSVADVLQNKNTTTDREIWVPEVDGAGSAMLKSLGYIFKEAYEPRVLEDAISARNAIGGDYSEFSDSPLGELLDGAYPIKVHPIDLEQQYRRFLHDHSKRMKLVADKKYKLYSKKPIGDAEIKDIYDEEYEGRRALNAELLRVARGFEGLGVSSQSQYEMMTAKGSGIGKNKAQLLFYGAMDRPSINKGFAEELYKRNLQHRLQPLMDQMNEYNRYLPIEVPE